jgi:hypothetical protein
MIRDGDDVAVVGDLSEGLLRARGYRNFTRLVRSPNGSLPALVVAYILLVLVPFVIFGMVISRLVIDTAAEVIGGIALVALSCGIYFVRGISLTRRGYHLLSESQ